MADPLSVDSFEIAEVDAARQQAGRAYLEFLRVPALSMGVYAIPAGGADPQKPHTEDEVYYVVHGRAMFRVGEEERTVRPGTVFFVAAGVAHRFHSVTEELLVLVFFAPAEYSRAPGSV
jgi:mannose-6-phosphate isomerase-like protein (cupin superfamily)